MGARGINLAEDGHPIIVVPPGSVSGGVSGQIFSLKGASKANIFIQWGAIAAAQGTVQLFACTSLAGANPVAIPFDLYQQTTSGAGNDVLGAPQSIAAAGYTPSDTADVLDMLHVQADYLPDGSAYLKLVINDGTNADFAAVLAVLTGLRNGGQQNPSATV
jgi:hypothetical protein